MRAARTILIALAACASLVAVGAFMLAAGAEDNPDLGPPVHLQPTNTASELPTDPDGEHTNAPSPTRSGRGGDPGESMSTHRAPPPTSTRTDHGPAGGATPARTTPRSAGNDDDEDHADTDDHDEDSEEGEED